MKRFRKLLAVMLCLAMLVSLAAACGDKKDDANEGEVEEIKMYLITMDSQDQHWLAVDQGAKDMAKGLAGVEVVFQAPDVKDGSKQIEIINNAVADNAKAILLAATDPQNVGQAVQNAMDKGVKVIYVDSPADVPVVSTLSTNNYNAGQMAGQEMLKHFEQMGVTSGAIGIVGVSTATNSTVNREQGFISQFEGTDFEILEPMYADGDAAKSQDLAVNLINANSNLVGIFGSNEGSSTGVGNAIKDTGNIDTIVGVGFDKSNTLETLVNEGALEATMIQNPYTMGYLGVAQAYAAVKGYPTGPAVIDTGVGMLLPK